MNIRWLMLVALCPWLALATSCGSDPVQAGDSDAADVSAAASLGGEEVSDPTDVPVPGAHAELRACVSEEGLNPGLPAAPATVDSCADAGLDSVTLLDYAHMPGSFVVGRILDIRPDTGDAFVDAARPFLAEREECDAVVPHLVMELELLRHVGGYRVLDLVDTLHITLGGQESLPTGTGWRPLDEGGWCWTEGTDTAPAPGMIIGGPIWYSRRVPEGRFTFAISPFNRIFAVDGDDRVALQTLTASECAPLEDLWATIEGTNVDTLMDMLEAARLDNADETRVNALRELIGVSEPVDTTWAFPHLYPACEGHQPPPEPTVCPPAPRCEWPNETGFEMSDGCRGCRELAPAGDACETWMDCYAQHLCIDGRCALAHEQSCTSMEDCGGAVSCVEGTCAAPCHHEGIECLGEAECRVDGPPGRDRIFFCVLPTDD